MALRKPVKEEFWKITSGYGPRVNPFPPPKVKYHYGIDLDTPWGTPIYAVDDGVVKKIDYDDVSGLYMIVEHPDNLESRFAHLYTWTKPEGTEIKKGEMIGETGESGNVTGPHLHFGLKKNGRFINPADEKLYYNNLQPVFIGLAAAFSIYKILIPYLERKK